MPFSEHAQVIDSSRRAVHGSVQRPSSADGGRLRGRATPILRVQPALADCRSSSRACLGTSV
eukprot:3549299-Alexandrium_andersonii.AAC.1